ncbi:MAG: hypothetical protein WC718_07290 [Phycisphaerales bacterium]|jgi:hypothetical protein
MMTRGWFLKSLVALPFVPSVLERLGTVEPPAAPVTPADDGSWVVEFRGATFTLDTPGLPAYATAPFECRMGVDHLDNGWKRPWVSPSGQDMTYTCLVRRGPIDMDWANLGVTGSPQGMISLVTPRRVR